MSSSQTGHSGVNANDPTAVLGELLLTAQERYGKWVHEVRFTVQENQNGPIDVVFHDQFFTQATVRIQAGVDPNQRRFQLALETIHLLSPVSPEELTFFEEGLSQVFAFRMTEGLVVSNDKYARAHKLCEALEKRCGGDIVRRLRKKEPYISRITSAQIIELCPGFPSDDAAFLCKRWSA